MSINRALTHAWRIASLLILAAGAQAQTTLRPMTPVRLTIDNQVTTVRIVRADTAFLLVEDLAGERRTIARKDITAIERRSGRAKRGAAILGGVGVAAGLALAAVFSAGCATSDCDDELVPAIAALVAIGGGIGAVGGAVIGHFVGGWRALHPDVRVQAMGASVGAKASFSLGPQAAAGLIVRLQRVGTEKQSIESSIGLSFRP